jgi:hypothetical protein
MLLHLPTSEVDLSVTEHDVESSQAIIQDRQDGPLAQDRSYVEQASLSDQHEVAGDTCSIDFHSTSPLG